MRTKKTGIVSRCSSPGNQVQVPKVDRSITWMGCQWPTRARPSQSEPLLRLNVGATNQARLDEERQILLSKFDRIIRGNKK
jgi:hypothetical protein